MFGAAAAGLTAVALLLGGALRDSSTASSAPLRTAATSADIQTGFSTGNTAELIERLQEKLRTDAYDVTSLDSLGLAYQQRARETGDPTYYTKSEEALRRARQLAPRDLIATSGLGSLALSRHRFREALAFGRRAHAISPTTARNYGVIGDALVELGRYREVFAHSTRWRLSGPTSRRTRVSRTRAS
jgi:tetratricopeptide (TPR) repeat protein